MIRTRGEYKFMTIDAGIVIDGGIMPKRDAANDGSWRILRGEDPAFLNEAIYERLHAAGIFAYGSGYNVDRAVYGSYMLNVARGIRGAAFTTSRRFGFIKGRTFSTVAHGSSESFASQFGPSISFSDNDFSSSEKDFANGKPLKAESVRHLYDDIRKLTVGVGYGWGSSHDWTMSKTGNYDLTSDPGPCILNSRRIRRDGSVRTTEWRVSSGHLTIRPTRPDMVETCTAMLDVTAFDSDVGNKYFFHPVEAQKTGDEFIIGSSGLKSIESVARSFAGIYPRDPSADGERLDCTISIYAVTPIFTLTDHTRFWE